MSTKHAIAAARFLENKENEAWHDHTLWMVRTKRDKMSHSLPEWERLRELASEIKLYSNSHLDTLLEEFEKNAIANGAIVHWAKDAEEHNEIVLRILRQHDARNLIKSKSMLTEECHMNEFLMSKGIDVVESDLGERILQLMHLERNDFIIEKQKEEMNRLDVTRQYREHQLETANQKMQEVESRTNILIETAYQKERQSEDLDKAISEKRSKLNREKGSELLNAAVGWATGKSKALKNEIEDLRSEISTHEETIEQLQCKIQTMQSDHNRELMNLKSKYQSELSRKETEHAQETTRLKNRIAWQNHIIGCLSFLLLKTSDIFRKAVNCIIRLARDYYKPRFDTEQVSDIKKALDLFGDERQSHHAAGDFLYITAMQKGKLDNREQIKARREVENVVGGHYDQQQRRGFSMRR